MDRSESVGISFDPYANSGILRLIMMKYMDYGFIKCRIFGAHHEFCDNLILGKTNVSINEYLIVDS